MQKYTTVESDTLNSGEGRYVTIYENGFATSVAFSWIDGNRRLITYADNLDENSNTFTVTILLVTSLLDLLQLPGLIAAAVFCVFAALLQMNFLSVSLDWKKREFGILRAIGAHKSDIVTISVVEAVLVAAIIFVITLLLTAVACIVTNHYLFVPVMIFDVWPILILFGLSFGMSLLASAIPVYRAVSKKPIDIINVR